MSSPSAQKTILLVEDDPALAMGLVDALEFEGFKVLHADRGQDAIDKAHKHRPDAIILDLMLPDLNGYQVCEQVRKTDPRTPIIMLTARSQEADKIRGLDAGADDYVTKPFAFEELLARVEALARRPRQVATPVLRVGDLEVDTSTREVKRGGRPIELTPKEYAVLEYLVRHQGRVMSRTLITEYAWDYHFDPGTNIVDVVVNRLRKKLEQNDGSKILHTVRGVGYVVKAG